MGILQFNNDKVVIIMIILVILIILKPIFYFISLHLWFMFSWNSRAWFPYKSILFLE